MIAFKEIYSCSVDESGEDIVIWLEMNDGSMRVSCYALSRVIENSHEVQPAEHAPIAATIQ